MENTASVKTQVLTESMYTCIWETDASNQLFMRGSYTKIKFSKIDNGKTAFFVIGPFFTAHSICLNIGF